MARRALTAALALAAVGSLSACGSQGIDVPKDSPYYEGARLFSQRCSGCHTLSVVGAQGSATKVRDRERVDGPNFNQRKEQKDGILYAIENGGFSSGPMPQNILTGEEKQKVAEFVAKYSGQAAASSSGR